MKKLFSLIFTIFVTICLSPAENLQLVMPKIIYIGDTVEIRYIFHSEAKIFSGDFSDSQAAFLSLNKDYDFFKANEADFSVKNVTLEKINAEYTLTMTVIPWRTGFLQIPPFNLNSLVNSSMDFAVSKKSPVFTPFIINLSPIEVKSLVSKTKNKSFMPQSSPLVMSGTTGLLVILSISALVIFSTLIFILLHIPKVAVFVRNLNYLYSLKKNSRKTIKRLLKLKNESPKIHSDKDFSEKLQHILRDFLNKRFSHDFSSITTGRFYALFTDLCGGELGENQSTAVENLISIFSRLDYIRFSNDSKFLSESENGGTKERISITEASVSLIADFDNDEI